MAFFQTIDAAGGSTLRVLGKIINANILIPVNFADGSTLKFVLKRIEDKVFEEGGIKFIFEYKKGSEKDKKVIPFQKQMKI